MIHVQDDKKIIHLVNKTISDIFEIYRLEISDISATITDKKELYATYDKNKSILKTSILDSHLNKLSDILTDRFIEHGGNTRIAMEIYRGTSPASIVMPSIDFKILNMAKRNLDALFPKKRVNGVLWETIATDSEKNTYDTLKDIRDSLDEGNFNIDLKNAKIKGLKGSTFVININPLLTMVMGLEPDEVTSILLHEVGHIFTYLEYMNVTSRTTLTMVDTFIHERFNKEKDPIDSIQFAMDESKSGVKIDKSNPITVIEGLESFILKTYRLDSSKKSIQIDFENLADKFVSMFGLGDRLSASLVKLASNGTLLTEDVSYQSSSPILTVLKVLISIITFIFTILFFSIFGLLIFIAYMGIKAIELVMSVIINLITSVFKIFFGTDVDQSTIYDDMVTRLNRIKLDTIKLLRSSDTGATGREILVDQIDSIKSHIDLVKDKFSILKRYGDSLSNGGKFTNTDISNMMIEELTNNDLHHMGAKFDVLNR